MASLPAPHRKVYVPLESNPDVFTNLIRKLGVSKHLQVQDVFSLDDPELLAFTPRPAYALIFNLVTTDKYNLWRDGDERPRPFYNRKGEDELVVWFEQTIHNACGFYGILHSVANGPATKYIFPGSTLDRFLKEAVPLDRNARALALEGNRDIEEAYKIAAQQGVTAAPAVGEEVDYHYIAFVPNKTNDKIFLMDGVRKGPVDTGVALEEGDDFLEKAVKIVKQVISHVDGGLKFSLMALVHVDPLVADQ